MKHNLKAAEESLDLVYREKQQKMNELDVVVPLKLNQVEAVFLAPRGLLLVFTLPRLSRLSSAPTAPSRPSWARPCC